MQIAFLTWWLRDSILGNMQRRKVEKNYHQIKVLFEKAVRLEEDNQVNNFKLIFLVCS